MAHSPRLRVFFADAEHEFVLDRIKLIHELEQKCDAPVRVIAQRLLTDAWRINDVYETIRIAAIGAGMKPEEAHGLVTRYVIEDTRKGWAASVPVARSILMAHLVGIPDEPVGKLSAEGTASGATDASSSPRSTA